VRTIGAERLIRFRKHLVEVQGLSTVNNEAAPVPQAGRFLAGGDQKDLVRPRTQETKEFHLVKDAQAIGPKRFDGHAPFRGRVRATDPKVTPDGKTGLNLNVEGKPRRVILPKGTIRVKELATLASRPIE